MCLNYSVPCVLDVTCTDGFSLCENGDCGCVCPSYDGCPTGEILVIENAQNHCSLLTSHQCPNGKCAYEITACIGNTVYNHTTVSSKSSTPSSIK
jgi:hypothetical protein